MNAALIILFCSFFLLGLAVGSFLVRRDTERQIKIREQENRNSQE